MGRVQVETQFSYPPSPQLQPQSRGISDGAQPYHYQPPQQQPKYVVPLKYDNNNVQLFSNNNVQEYQQQQSSTTPMQMQQSVGVASKASFQSTTTAIGVPQQGPRSPLQVINNTTSNNKPMLPWTTGLFDCMDNPTNALVTAIFPCVTFGQIADVLENGNTTCATSGIIYAAAPCMVSRPYRKKMRQRFGLAEAPSSDWIVHSMFEPCALCQEYRELINRGIDPALGYHGNMKMQQAERSPIRMAPPGNQMMMN